MTRVAEKTGLERTHLYRKLKQLGVEPGKLGKKNASATVSSADRSRDRYLGHGCCGGAREAAIVEQLQLSKFAP